MRMESEINIEINQETKIKFTVFVLRLRMLSLKVILVVFGFFWFFWFWRVASGRRREQRNACFTNHDQVRQDLTLIVSNYYLANSLRLVISLLNLGISTTSWPWIFNNLVIKSTQKNIVRAMKSCNKFSTFSGASSLRVETI